MMKNIAVILAGGSGLRLGADMPKQFLKVRGRMIIEHTIDIFHQHNEIDEIVIVCHADYLQLMYACVLSNNYSKVSKVLPGGSERYHSSVVAIDAYENDGANKILFHDAVRPLVTNNIITNCLTKLNTYKAVGVGVKSTDTIWNVADGIIVEIPDRNRIFRAQTPQGFTFDTIKEAYRLAMMDDNIISTDDCGIVRKYLSTEKIATVYGDDTNIKITRKEDLDIFESILRSRQ